MRFFIWKNGLKWFERNEKWNMFLLVMVYILYFGMVGLYSGFSLEI